MAHLIKLSPELAQKVREMVGEAPVDKEPLLTGVRLERAMLHGRQFSDVLNDLKGTDLQVNQASGLHTYLGNLVNLLCEVRAELEEAHPELRPAAEVKTEVVVLTSEQEKLIFRRVLSRTCVCGAAKLKCWMVCTGCVRTLPEAMWTEVMAFSLLPEQSIPEEALVAAPALYVRALLALGKQEPWQVVAKPVEAATGNLFQPQN